MKYNILVLILLLNDGAGARRLRGGKVTCFQACSANTCCNFRCGANVPYVCTEGIAIRGCSGGLTYWKDTQDCQACCDLSQCGDLSLCDDPRNDPLHTCEKDCSEEVCREQACSEQDRYACIEGGTDNDASIPIYGCNGNKTYWLHNDLNCKDCCDTFNCPLKGRVDPTCEQECSEEVCSNHTCSSEHPFACTEGGTDSDATQVTYGCNKEPDYWLETELNCRACCDVRKCENGDRVDSSTTSPETTTSVIPSTTTTTTTTTTSATTTTKPEATPCGDKSRGSHSMDFRHHRRRRN